MSAGEPSSGRAEQPSKPVRLADMIYTIGLEAYRIREGQTALIMAGLRKEPWPEAIRKAEVMEAAVRYLEKQEPVLGSIIQIIKSAEEAEAGAQANDDGEQGET